MPCGAKRSRRCVESLALEPASDGRAYTSARRAQTVLMSPSRATVACVTCRLFITGLDIASLLVETVRTVVRSRN